MKQLKLKENCNIFNFNKYHSYKNIVSIFYELKKQYNCDYDMFCISITGKNISDIYKQNVYITNSNKIDSYYMNNNLIINDPIPLIEQSVKKSIIIDFNDCYNQRFSNRNIDGNRIKKFLKYFDITNGIFFFFNKDNYVISYRFVCDIKIIKFSRYENFCKHFINITENIAYNIYKDTYNIESKKDVYDKTKIIQ